MIAAVILCLLAALSALGLDWLQTLRIARNPATMSEINVILGPHPAVARVCWYFGAWIVVVALLTGLLWWYALPWIALALCAVIALFEAVVVWRNYRTGDPA